VLGEAAPEPVSIRERNYRRLAAIGYSRLGRSWATAVTCAIKVAKEGMPNYPLFDKDPNLNNLRADPQFAAFLARLKSQWEHFSAVL
jgi:hypothetical protein